MFLLGRNLVEPSLLLMLNALTGALNNILATGGFKSVLLIYDNQTDGVATYFLQRRWLDVDYVIFNVDSGDAGRKVAHISFEDLQLRAGTKVRLVVPILQDVHSLQRSLAWISRMKLPIVSTKALAIFIENSDDHLKEEAMKSLMSHIVDTGLIFWNEGSPQAFASDFFRMRHLILVGFGQDLAHISAQAFFYQKFPKSFIKMEQYAIAYFVVDDANDFADFLLHISGRSAVVFGRAYRRPAMRFELET